MPLFQNDFGLFIHHSSIFLWSSVYLSVSFFCSFVVLYFSYSMIESTIHEKSIYLPPKLGCSPSSIQFFSLFFFFLLIGSNVLWTIPTLHFLSCISCFQMGATDSFLVPELFLQTEFPLLLRLNDAYNELPAFQDAMPEKQPDYVPS